ncbi:methyltransferase domain-containing protein [Nocardiopsis protaetiae]|uniref:methyltransferase domain-containing protein n=1 Tax=Nocardiopsis protaetiae TaxID=3382270 RepID=UPI00387AE770
MTDLHRMHAELAGRLDTTDAIRAAFADHPRHHFIPDLVWPDIQGLPLIRSAAPARWAAYVYGDDAVVTQANDGGGGPVNEPSSSSSAPQLMADMIAAARVGPGMRVLEIGAGTGWNAAILSSLVGPTGAVTSLEIDPKVAEHARIRLKETPVEVVHGTEPPEGASYDAVIATCAVSRVPGEWVERVEPDGLIVLPWGPYPWSHATPVAALRRAGSTAVAGEGEFVCEAYFMRDRTQRVPKGEFPGMGRDSESTRVVPFTPADLMEDDRLTRIMLTLPGVRIGIGMRPFSGDIGFIVYMGAPDSSWAYLWPDGTVHQGGPTPLADRLREAHDLLAAQGWPPLTDFSLEADTATSAYRVGAEFGAWEHRV